MSDPAAELRNIRESMCLSQVAFAARLGLSASHVAHLEQGVRAVKPRTLAHARLLTRARRQPARKAGRILDESPPPSPM